MLYQPAHAGLGYTPPAKYVNAIDGGLLGTPRAVHLQKRYLSV